VVAGPVDEGRQSPRSPEVEPLEVSEIFQISEFQSSNKLHVLQSMAPSNFSEFHSSNMDGRSVRHSSAIQRT